MNAVAAKQAGGGNLIADRVIQVMRKRGVSPATPVKPKIALPVQEQTSLETDDYLQDL
jgi:hypothetical protein